MMEIDGQTELVNKQLWRVEKDTTDDEDSKPEATTKSTIKVEIKVNIPKGREANNANLLYKVAWTPEEIVQEDDPSSPTKAKEPESHLTDDGEYERTVVAAHSVNTQDKLTIGCPDDNAHDEGNNTATNEPGEHIDIDLTELFREATTLHARAKPVEVSISFTAVTHERDKTYLVATIHPTNKGQVQVLKGNNEPIPIGDNGTYNNFTTKHSVVFHSAGIGNRGPTVTIALSSTGEQNPNLVTANILGKIHAETEKALRQPLLNELNAQKQLIEQRIKAAGEAKGEDTINNLLEDAKLVTAALTGNAHVAPHNKKLKQATRIGKCTFLHADKAVCKITELDAHEHIKTITKPGKGTRADQSVTFFAREKDFNDKSILTDPTFPKTGGQHCGELIVTFDVKRNESKKGKNNLDYAINVARY